ncbi:polysaccharide pyruvyl transferase family protein [Globicatella sp. PHS-GS-PNBC-21-1553]|uniref:polysaccharide pyruvyl transferase family protein n=1 Tax=Globicatella sp. PHS-GS-PNBC-21-1553 TaxID=2885764 RepID=UPI00298EDED5|nr:polysaccharide pyruvyl transferase family protein [Globicatella sp. PHS-GS-PNBC-21-1553]WPC09065.1 polysaccharide pyruvyl transferase family protein [Globicatella sp. PHS-GS-PNBC-21-1553]
MKKLAITGPFADVNFGDYGMLVNNLYDFNYQDYIIYSYDDTFLNTLNKDYFKEINIQVIDVVLNNTEPLTVFPYTPLQIIENVKNKTEIIDSFSDVETLIVNGGGYFNSLWSMPHRFERLIKIIAPILIADFLNKKIVFTGNSYGPFGDDFEFFATFFSSLKNSTYGVRDQLYSPMWFNQLGVKKELTFIPDDLLVLNEKIKNMTAKNKLDINAKYIVIETYLSLDYIENNIVSFNNLVSTLSEKHNTKVVFLPLHLQHGGNDQGKFLKNNISDLIWMDISKKGYLPLEDAVEIIKNAELVISSRYHALVFSTILKTPIISHLRTVMEDKRYYYNKNIGLLNQVFKGMVVDLEKIVFNDYIDAIEYVTENFQEIIDYQNSLYNNPLVDSNFNELKKIREDFIEKHIKNGEKNV